MFRDMRRKKRELPEKAAEELLRTCRRGVLAMQGDDGYPYAVPINFCFDKETHRIYFHGARAGHKADALDACPKVCFTVYGNESVRKETWAPFVQSAVVFGLCRVIEDAGEAEKRLRQLAMKYYPEESLADEEIAKSGAAVRVYEIEIEHLTGKEIQEK